MDVVELPTEAAVGRRIPRIDGVRKLSGAEIFGADEWPPEALTARAVRSPYAHAAFAIGDVEAFKRAHPGIIAIFTAEDVPGANCYGVIAPFADQPVLAEGVVRFRGEAVALVVGDTETMRHLDLSTFPVTWSPLRGSDDHRRGARGERRTHSRAPPPQHPHERTCSARRCCRGPRRGGRRRRRAPSRRVSSSTRILSRRRVSLAASAIASRSRPARRRPIWIATVLRRFSASRPSRCASFRRRSAAASAQSSICRSSPSSRSPPGCSIGRSAWSIRAANRS